MKKERSINRVKIFGKIYDTEQLRAAAVLMTPVLVALVFLFIMPVAQVVYYCFTDFNLRTQKGKFVGLDNFKFLFTDAQFGKAIRNTFVFALVKIVFETALALLVALALDSRIPFRKYLRTSFFAPVVVPVVASSLIWIWFFDPGVGPLNQILEFLHLPPLKWLSSPNTSMLSIVLFSIWKGLGYNVMLFLTGLQGIPDSYVEAAQVDGAKPSQILFKIKLPLLRPITNFVVMMGIINTFKVFAEVDVMTPKGGPLYSTALMVNYIYETAFTRAKLGRGCAAAIVLFLIVFILTSIQNHLEASKTVSYD